MTSVTELARSHHDLFQSEDWDRGHLSWYKVNFAFIIPLLFISFLKLIDEMILNSHKKNKKNKSTVANIYWSQLHLATLLTDFLLLKIETSEPDLLVISFYNQFFIICVDTLGYGDSLVDVIGSSSEILRNDWFKCGQNIKYTYNYWPNLKH